MHDVTVAVNDLYRCSCRAVLILLLFRFGIDCLLSLYGSCLIRSTLSFPTARSIFKLPAVFVLKNLPEWLRGNAYFIVSPSFIIIERHLVLIGIIAGAFAVL